jgi:phosphomannomutase
MQQFSTIFKAYDVRGTYPDQLNAGIAARIGQAYAAVNKPKKVAVGRDVRSSGQELQEALVQSLLESGVDVVDIGVITTDQLYFAVGNYGYDGGISVTASHNPAEYNGFKFAEKGGGPITSEILAVLRDWAASDAQTEKAGKGKLSTQEILDDYVAHVLSYIDTQSIKPMRVLANANFGAVGRAMDNIPPKLGIDMQRLNWEEDGSFPKGTPNPLLPENRDETIEKLKQSNSDLGVAWDADADRCFFFTGAGEFIPSCYIIALLAPEFLKKYPGAKIVHDLTTAWVMDEAITKAGGLPVSNRTGHTFIKARMRQEDSPFAGESSGHYYFRDSFSADNGIVPFLMILEMVSRTGKTLGELVKPLMDEYKVSGEINFTVENPKKVLDLIEAKLGNEGEVDKTDGLVINSPKWRFSARTSNTEPLLRLNAESKSQQDLDALVGLVSRLIQS